MARHNGFKILYDLSSDWRLGHDQLQWVLEQRGGTHWRARYFVAGKKSTLERLLREEGAYPLSQAGGVLMRGLSETFDTFKQPDAPNWINPWRYEGAAVAGPAPDRFASLSMQSVEAGLVDHG